VKKIELEESPTKVKDNTIMESKALIVQSPTSTTKTRPIPLKTMSPNRKSQSPSQSPKRI
jgi:hypothetical protein